VELKVNDFRACESGAEATALQTLREDRMFSNYAEASGVWLTAVFGRAERGWLKVVIGTCESGVAAPALPPQSKTRWRAGWRRHSGRAAW